MNFQINPADLRVRCRNGKCRMKIDPTDNKRRAFCCKGCFAVFHRRRCVVCQGEIVRRTEQQRLCQKADCRNEYERNRGLYLPFEVGSYPSSQNRVRPPRNPIKTGVKTAHKSRRGPAEALRVRSARGMIEVLPDEAPGLWRVHWPDGVISPTANLSRCRDAARAWCEQVEVRS
jgi:hypothetical protein